MKLASFDGGFGRVENDAIVPMGPDLAEYLCTGGPATARRSPSATCSSARPCRGPRR